VEVGAIRACAAQVLIDDLLSERHEVGICDGIRVEAAANSGTPSTLSRLGAHPPRREHVASAGEEGEEQRNLLARRGVAVHARDSG